MFLRLFWRLQVKAQKIKKTQTDTNNINNNKLTKKILEQHKIKTLDYPLQLFLLNFCAFFVALSLL